MKYNNLKLWPFDEAKKLLKRIELRTNQLSPCIFETGYGPSGLPHIGTFAEVLRTTMVIKAFKKISNRSTKLIVFSDDMDGLRKVPENIPNQELIKKNLFKSLSEIPDPFEKFNSFAEHNNNKLTEFLDKFNFDYEFKSSSQLYKSGFFNPQLKDILKNYEKVRNIILPTLGKDRRETYSPFLPICPNTRKVLQVKVNKIDISKNTILYFDPDTKEEVEVSILDGNCKLQWKVDWAMRWKALSIDYEMNGKDLIESFQLSSKINRIIGSIPPNNLTYELFLDEKGEKISKSIGNGISVDEWLEFSPKESLELFMFQAPKRAKKLYFDSIPKSTDEFIKLKNDYKNLNLEDKMNNPCWFLDFKESENIPQGLTFNMILNLASVCKAENSEILWGFIEKYYPTLEKKNSIFLAELLEFGVKYYKRFIVPFKVYRKPNALEYKGFTLLVEMLDSLKGNETAEEVQNKIYEIGVKLSFDNLKDWFKAIYEVILGQKQGPRIGSFIKLYGIDKTKELIIRLNKK